jgi:hypothetical protein
MADDTSRTYTPDQWKNFPTLRQSGQLRPPTDPASTDPPSAAAPAQPPGPFRQFAGGVGEGVIGATQYGAEQLAGQINPAWGPSAEETKAQNRPSASWEEAAGRTIGGALPTAAGYMIGGLPGLATRAAIGGVGGALQPTESGSLSSHAWNAAAGTLASMVPFAPKAVLQSADGMAAWLATFLPRAALGSVGFWEWPLYDAIRRLGLVSGAASLGQKLPQAGGLLSGLASQAAEKAQQEFGWDQPPRQ